MSVVRESTNPYVVELNRLLADRVTLVQFSWRALLTGRWEVFHLHWPDAMVRRAGPVRSLGACVLLSAGVLRARWSGRRIVRTLHNVEPHERQGLVVRATLRLVDRATNGWIRLNDHTPSPPHGFVVTIPHGTYADWYADAPHPARVPGRLVYAGLVRPYKGVDDLIATFEQLDGPDLSLHVSGRPADADYGRTVARLANRDPRIVVDLRHVPDDVLAREIGEAMLVVLPYREMHNSGAALLALSLDRPVLVPANGVTDALACEVGEQWVQRFSGELDADALRRALEAVRALVGSPDLSARSWEAIADAHVAAFVRAVGVEPARSLAV